MGLRGWLRRLEREAEEEMVVIPQRYGPPARFPTSALKDAYLNLIERMGAGEDAPPEHPLLVAVRNSSDPEWTATFYFAADPDEVTRPVPDLSEP